MFSLTPPRSAKGSWTESIVWSFGGNGNDGDSPNAAVIMDTSGNLFGTTEHGGTHNTAGGGTVFEISSVLTGSPASLNFGEVAAPGTSKPKKVTLINKGSPAAHISNVSATAPFKIASAANTCSGQIIAPKKHCSFEVEFAPTSVGDVTDGSIDVTYNGASPAVALAGNGT